MFFKQLMSSLAAILLSCARFQGQEAANLVNKAVLATAQHLSIYLSWLMTAKPAGCKLHIQLSQLLGEAGLVLVRQSSVLVLATSSYAVPAAIGALGLALLLSGPQAGLTVVHGLVYICSLPTTLAYAALATAYRWHLWAVVYLGATFCGRCTLLPTTAKAGTGLGSWLAKPSSESVPSVRTLRRESLGEVGVQQQPSLPNLTASILLLVPLLLLLPTLAVSYGSACALHCLGMAVRLLIYCAWQSASKCNSLQGAQHHGVSQQQECETAKCKGASPACQERSGGSSLGFAPRPEAAFLQDVLLNFLRGNLVGHQPLWPACV